MTLEEEIREAKQRVAEWPQWMKDAAYFASPGPPGRTTETRNDQLESNADQRGPQGQG